MFIFVGNLLLAVYLSGARIPSLRAFSIWCWDSCCFCEAGAFFDPIQDSRVKMVVLEVCVGGGTFFSEAHLINKFCLVLH